jgi:phosphoribosylformylglycinamidine (FGAM) synthase-like enzyme
VTIDEDKLLEIEKISSRYSVPCTTVGKVTDDGRLKINNEIDIEVDKLRKAYTEAIPKIMEAGSTE